MRCYGVPELNSHLLWVNLDHFRVELDSDGDRIVFIEDALYVLDN